MVMTVLTAYCNGNPTSAVAELEAAQARTRARRCQHGNSQGFHHRWPPRLQVLPYKFATAPASAI